MIIDFHAHILPGLDHGSEDVNTSLQQLGKARRAGVELIVATSHFYPHRDSVDDFLLRRDTAVRQLLFESSEVLPKIILGAETLVCEGMAEMKGLMNLTFGSQNAILLEMPTGQWSFTLLDTVEKINQMTKGHVVIAHVDRYDPNKVETLFELGVRGQLNADSLCRFNRRGTLLGWVREGKIAALGSDIHGNSNGYRKFHRAISILGREFSPLMRETRELLGDYTPIN